VIRLFTFGAAAEFPGEVVLDPFCGGGTTCWVARTMGRRYIGIDVNPDYVNLARHNVTNAPAEPPLLLVGRPKFLNEDELIALAAEQASNGGNSGSIGKAAGTRKHKTKRYGKRRTDKK
jgi:hypothetical protein